MNLFFLIIIGEMIGFMLYIFGVLALEHKESKKPISGTLRKSREKDADNKEETNLLCTRQGKQVTVKDAAITNMKRAVGKLAAQR